MKMSAKGIEFLKRLEGRVIVNGKHVVYDDATGRPVHKNTLMPAGATIGYGHLIRRGEDFGNGLTEAQATQLLQQDLTATYDTIAKQINCDVLASMKQHEYDALVALVFNIGPGSAAQSNANRGLYQSTIRKYLNNKNYKDAIYPTPEHAWKAFRNRGTLDSRRDAEWRLYHDADYSGIRMNYH
ncbi:MAG: lysozyme [Alphaproteobacteria bacterium]|nr:lysozyme [Alphaproteobacteria bacterium]